MAMVRLRCWNRYPSEVGELLESYISHSEVVPKGAYRISERDSARRAVREPFIHKAKEGQS